MSKNPFDIDFGIRKERRYESKLTQTQKNRIKNLIGICEISLCTGAPFEVHHIKWLEDGGTDAYSNLIVLCSNHHKDAHGKNPSGKSIPKSKLHNLVNQRSKQKSDEIKAILKGVGG